MNESDDEELDPRIQVELEKLNVLSQEINHLESELNKARNRFRHYLSDSTQHLHALTKKCGDHIDKAKPYYEARLKARIMQSETQQAALRFEKACSQLAAAKETVEITEEGYKNRKQEQFDPVWQEVLNQSTIKVNEAEMERHLSSIAHENVMAVYTELEKEIRYLEKNLRRNITKSKPYFDTKARFNAILEEQRNYVNQLEAAVKKCKEDYATTLKVLEQISEQIHQQRREQRIRLELGERQSGVGSENPDKPPDELKPDGAAALEKLQAAGVVYDPEIQAYVYHPAKRRTVSMLEASPEGHDSAKEANQRANKTKSTLSLELTKKEQALEVVYNDFLSSSLLERDNTPLTKSSSESNLLDRTLLSEEVQPASHQAVLRRPDSFTSPARSDTNSDSSMCAADISMLNDDAIDKLNLEFSELDVQDLNLEASHIRIEHQAVAGFHDKTITAASQNSLQHSPAVEYSPSSGRNKLKTSHSKSSVTDGVILECTKL